MDLDFDEQSFVALSDSIRRVRLDLSQYELEKIITLEQMKLKKSIYAMDYWITTILCCFTLLFAVLQFIDGIPNDLTTTLLVLGLALVVFCFSMFRLSRKNKSNRLEWREMSRENDRLDIRIELLTQELVAAGRLEETVVAVRLTAARREMLDSLVEKSSHEQSDKVKDGLRRRTAAPAA